MSFLKDDSGTMMKLFDFYNKEIYPLDDFNYSNIYLSDNFVEDIFLFCTPKEFETLNDSGVTLLPNEKLEEIVVVINANTTFPIETVIHELTHVRDFINFSKKYYGTKYYNIMEHNLFECYRRWSEFHAFAYGNFYAIKFYHSINPHYEENYEEGLIKFLERKREKVLDNNFEPYDLCGSLGCIYALDMYNAIDSFENSSVFQYLSVCLPPKFQEKVYPLYRIYFESVQNRTIFDSLLKIQDLEEEIYS